MFEIIGDEPIEVAKIGTVDVAILANKIVVLANEVVVLANKVVVLAIEVIVLDSKVQHHLARQ